MADEEKLVERFLEWVPTSENLSNGLVLEIVSLGNPKCQTILIQKIFQILNIHPNHQKSKNLKRLYSGYISITVKEVTVKSCPWMFLEHLQVGGKLFKPQLLKPVSKLEEMLDKLNKALANNDVCQTCGNVGDNFCCQGCFSVCNCSSLCQNEGWLHAHQQDCPVFASHMFGDGLKPPPRGLLSSVQERSLLGKYRNSLKLINQLEKKEL